MADTWFRFYNNAVNDPKVQRLSPVLFRFWVNILCLASSNDGELPSLHDMEFSLRLTSKQLSDFIGQLVSYGLLDQENGGFSPHNWSTRQYKSDGSTERVKRFRKRFKTVSETSNGTGPDTEQIITEQNRDGFELFWVAMPKKEKKAEALQAYLQALPSVSAEVLISAAKNYGRRYLGEDAKFSTNVVAWLQNRRWEDESKSPRRKSAFNSPEELAAQKRLEEIANGQAQ